MVCGGRARKEEAGCPRDGFHFVDRDKGSAILKGALTRVKYLIALFENCSDKMVASMEKAESGTSQRKEKDVS